MCAVIGVRTMPGCSELTRMLLGANSNAADLVSPLASGADNAQGGDGSGAARLDALEENTLELEAVLGAVGIDPAVAAIEGGAGVES